MADVSNNAIIHDSQNTNITIIRTSQGDIAFNFGIPESGMDVENHQIEKLYPFTATERRETEILLNNVLNPAKDSPKALQDLQSKFNETLVSAAKTYGKPLDMGTSPLLVGELGGGAMTHRKGQDQSVALGLNLQEIVKAKFLGPDNKLHNMTPSEILNASYGAAGQARLGQVGDATVFAGGSIGANETGITGGNAWVNVIGEPAKVGPVHVVPVSQANLNVPANGKLGLDNVTGMVGVVANPEGTQGNIAVLGSATLDGKKANVFADYSHDINLGNNTTITPHVGLTQQIVGGNATSLSGGARIHKTDLFDKTTGGALEVTAGTGNLRDKDPGWSVGVQAEVTFNNAEAKKESALEHALMEAAGKSRPIDSMRNSSEPASSATYHESLSNSEQYQQSAGSKPGVTSAQNDDGRQHTIIQPYGQKVATEHQNDPAGFLNMSHKQQVALVSRMTENYVKEHPTVAPDAAREVVVHALLNPQQSQQQVLEPRG